MIRILILMLSVCNAFAETLYVRPIAGEYGAENGTSYATAFDGFSDISWGAGAGAVSDGDTLIFCSGTAGFFGAADARQAAYFFFPSQSGSALNSMVTLDGDCSGQSASEPTRAIFDTDWTATAGCFQTNGHDYLLVKNFDFRNCMTSASPSYSDMVTANGNSTYVYFEDFSVNGGDGSGIGTLGTSSTVICQNIYWRRFTIQNTGAGGIRTAGGAQYVYYENGTIENTGLENGAHGVGASDYRSTHTSGWSLVSGNIYSKAVATPNDVNLVLVYTTQPYTWLTENTGTPTSPGANEFGYSAGTLYVNLNGTNPNTVSILATGMDTRYIYHKDLIIKNTNNWEPYQFNEGHGFAADDGVSDIYGERLFITDNEGNGINCNKCSNFYLNSIVIRNVTGYSGANGNGIYSEGRNVVIDNLTLDNVAAAGIQLNYGGTPHTHTVRNSIVTRAVTTGLSVSTSAGGLTAIQNNAFNNSTNRSATWSETGSLSTDPMYSKILDTTADAFILNGRSPLCAAGTYISAYVDYRNLKFHNLKPSIGAFECVLRDPDTITLRQ